jgi:hypothetical protein
VARNLHFIGKPLKWREDMARTKAAAGAIGSVSLLVLAGCASNQAVPLASLDAAERRIEEAERAEAQRYANRELNMAREKLLEAREALNDGDETRAARLAQLAELDATYAAATANNESVQAAVNELRETIATLETEIARQEDSNLPRLEAEEREFSPGAGALEPGGLPAERPFPDERSGEPTLQGL